MPTPASFVAATFLIACLAPAQSGTTSPPEPAPAAAEKPAAQDPPAVPEPSAKQQLAKYHPVEGTVKLGAMAEAKLPAGWLFLAGPDGLRFLRDNDNQPGPSILGVAIPPDFETFAVFSYLDDGHVSDDESPDYDDLLREMQEGTVEQSKERRKAGLGTVELLGWAEPPHYDKAQHKLYWAEKLKFGGNAGVTLNYNVRVLGRAGHLVINGVGDVEQLRLVAQRNQELLQVTEFVEGQRYENFDPDYDKVATYGIGGLVAGGMALKLGLFAKLGVLLKVAIKPILVGLVVVGGLIVKLFKGKKPPAKADAPAA